MFKRGEQPAPGKPASGTPIKPGKGGKGSAAPRRHKRHMGKGKARCALGEVLDISAGGMRIACPGKPPLKEGAAATVSIITSAGDESLNVRCCWVKRAGLFGKWQIGLKFIGITEGQAERLGVIAEYGFIPEHKQPKKPEAMSQDKPEAGDDSPVGAHVDLDLHPYFQTLGLEPDVQPAQIRDAYRRLVRTCHPDVSDTAESREMFMKIQQAYDILRSRAAQQRSNEAA